MANEIQNVWWTQDTAEKSGFLSKITWLFHKSSGESWAKQNQRLTNAFHLTRRDSIISMILAVVIVWWAIYYGNKVINEYNDINARYDELKNVSKYNIKPNLEKLSSYTDWDNASTINSMIEIGKKIEDEIVSDEIFKQQQKGYFEVLLQNIYLPALNVWKDPYTKNFNMWILWQKYLDTDVFQDLYMIQYWSNFARYVWNDAAYNDIRDVELWDKTVLEENPDYFYVPITISFRSPNKRSFLLLVNKLSMTSNQNNIALLNEFFFYLLRAIREQKADVIEQLSQEYRDEFSSSYNWDLASSLWEMSDDERAVYRDRVIWYNLYHWIKNDLTWDDIGQLIDDDVVLVAIKDTAMCTEKDNDQKCFYNFRDKYRNLPYLAYGIWLEGQSDRTAWLLQFLRDLPPAIAITDFRFEKYSDSSFLNNKEEEYEWTIKFNAYGRNIKNSELDEASIMLWKLCFWSTSDQKMSPELALTRVEETMISLWWSRSYTNMSSLWELQMLFTSIKDSYEDMSNYEKMVKLFELWRMMNDANLCNR